MASISIIPIEIIQHIAAWSCRNISDALDFLSTNSAYWSVATTDHFWEMRTERDWSHLRPQSQFEEEVKTNTPKEKYILIATCAADISRDLVRGWNISTFTSFDRDGTLDLIHPFADHPYKLNLSFDFGYKVKPSIKIGHVSCNLQRAMKHHDAKPFIAQALQANLTHFIKVPGGIITLVSREVVERTINRLITLGYVRCDVISVNTVFLIPEEKGKVDGSRIYDFQTREYCPDAINDMPYDLDFKKANLLMGLGLVYKINGEVE